MKISFFHFLRTRNQGDLACAPYHYVDFPGAELSYYDINDKPPAETDIAIFGGGALGYHMMRGDFPSRMRASLYVGWGVGRSIKRFKRNVVPSDVKWLNISGSRDWKHRNYTPCASVMHTNFNLRCNEIPGHIVGFYNFGRRRFTIDVEKNRINEFIHNQMPLQNIFAALRRAEYVVTNSYHGCLWSTWLRKKVIVYGPYSSKFHFFRHQPVLVNRGQSWYERLDDTQRYHDAHRLDLMANHKFIEKLSLHIPMGMKHAG